MAKFIITRPFARLLLLFLLVVTAVSMAHSTLRAQENGGPAIVCYEAAARSGGLCERLEDLGARQEPAWTVETASGGILPLRLSDYDLLYLDTDTGDTLDAALSGIRDFVEAGGGLILADPDFGHKLGRGIQAPRGTRTLPPTRSVEFTRASTLTPHIRELRAEQMPTTVTTVPLSTLGSGWTVQAKLVQQGDVTLATAKIGRGHVLLSPVAVDANYPLESYLLYSIHWALQQYLETHPSPDLSVSAIEVTQSVQDLNNSVLLVAGKQTFARVHASFTYDYGGSAVVHATLIGTHILDIGNGNTIEVPLFPPLAPVNPGGVAKISYAPDRGQLNDSFLFALPPTWTSNPNAELRLTVQVDPNGFFNDPTPENNSQSVTVNFSLPLVLRLRLFNVLYHSSFQFIGADEEHFDALESWLRRAFPVSSLDITRDEFVYPPIGPLKASQLNSYLATQRAMNQLLIDEKSNVVYYGLVSDVGEFMRGQAQNVPGYVASGPVGRPWDTYPWDTDNSYGDWYGGHEIAHTRGRPHAAFCGAEGNAFYPYTGGRISPALSGPNALYGFDIASREIYDPTWKDVMTYCDNQWISDYTYEHLYTYILFDENISQQPFSAQGTMDDALVVAAALDPPSQSGSFTSINLLPGPFPSPPPQHGEWSIALVNAQNAVLATYPVEVMVPTESDGSDALSLIQHTVPWVPGTSAVQLRAADNGIVDQQQVSAHLPAVNITALEEAADTVTVSWEASDADGDLLTASVLYSSDEGASWQALTTAWPTNSFVLDKSAVPGGAHSLLRVIVSDGLQTAAATSAPFTIANAAPQVQIISPADGAQVYLAVPVTLQAEAYDAEDGVLPGAAMIWHSDRDGLIATGNPTITVELSTGLHNISVTIADSEGQESTVSHTLSVLSANMDPEPALMLAPNRLNLIATYGDRPTAFTVTTRNVSNGELSWQAGSDAPWLQVSASGSAPGSMATGQTPGDLLATIDPGGLHPGEHSATLTLTSNSAPTIVVPVRVTIEGGRVYLPAAFSLP